MANFVKKVFSNDTAKLHNISTLSLEALYAIQFQFSTETPEHKGVRDLHDLLSSYLQDSNNSNTSFHLSPKLNPPSHHMSDGPPFLMSLLHGCCCPRPAGSPTTATRTTTITKDAISTRDLTR